MEPVVEEIDDHEVLNNEAREVVENVYTFMKKEASEGPIMVKQVQERVAKATGLSKKSVQRIIKEARNCDGGPNFYSRRKRRETNTENYNKCEIRKIFNEFLHTVGHHPSNRGLLLTLRKRINFKGSDWSLQYLIKKLGFKRKKDWDKSRILIEKSEIREKRLTGLQALADYRKEGRPVIYAYEKCIHSYRIIHAESENGFIHNPFFFFETDVQPDTLHRSVKCEIYEQWLNGNLIPNLPTKSIVVMDETLYNVPVNSVPTSLSKRADMINWLVQHNIPFDDEMFKPELYRLIKLNKSKFTIFKLDRILAKYGHSVLRLPKYHLDLNPLDQIWSAVTKDIVGDRINILNFSDFVNLVQEKINFIAKKEWCSIFRCRQETEKNYLSTDLEIDEAMERII